jgi:hypothetical protein
MKFSLIFGKLVCQLEEEILKIHDADLIHRFDVSTQNLDLVELSAIYFCIPENFTNDCNGLSMRVDEILIVLIQ